MNTAFRDEVKDKLDAACPLRLFEDRRKCWKECKGRPAGAWTYCWVCHRNDALAAEIAELLEVSK